MPHYNVTLEMAKPVPELFLYLTKPKNLIQLAPPELHLELLAAPDILVLGSRLVWKGRRYGVSQQITQEVVAFDQDKLIIVEQKLGPLRRWVHANHFEKTDTGTRIHEKIEFEPPGGLLGYVVTADALRRELEKLMVYREKKLKEIFG